MAANIKGITIEFNGDTTKLEKALEKIDGKARDTQKQLTAVNKALKYNPGNAELMAQKQQLLTERVKETETKLKELRAEQKRMDGNEIDKNSREYQNLRRQIIETESQVKHFKGQLDKVNNYKFDKLKKSFQDVGGKMQGVGKSMSMKVTAPLVGIGVAATKKFADVDKTMALTNAIMGNSEKEAELLSQAMKDAAANSTFGMEEASQATLNFARAGLTAEESAAALAPAMNLAAGEGGDLDTVSAGLTATINGFGGSFDEADKYADIFASACNNSALDIDSLSDSMSIAAPVFSAAGYEINDAALYMGVMANAGIDANVAANALKTGMANLANPSKNAQKWMDKLGISLTDSEGNMKDTVTLQKELHDAFSGLSESEQIAAASAIFGKNQMSNWMALIQTSPDEVKALSDELDESAGTVSKMADAMMSGFGGGIEKIKSSLDVAATSMGEALAPVVQKVGGYIQKMLDWFNELSPHQQRLVALFMGIAAAIGPVLLVGGKMVSGIGEVVGAVPSLMKAGKQVMKGMQTLGKFAMSNPWIIVAAAVATIAILIVKNWDKIGPFFEKLWASIVGFFQSAWDKITAIVSTVTNAIKQVIQAVFNGIKAYFLFIFNIYKTAIVTAFTIYKTIITTIINGIKKVITTVFGAIKTFFTTVFKAIRNTISNAWSAIKTTVTNGAKAIKDRVVSVFSSLKDRIAGIWKAIKSKTSSAWSAIKDAIVAPIRKASDTIKSIAGKLKDVFSFHFSMPRIKVPHFSISPAGWKMGDLLKGSIPHLSVNWYANGGIFSSPSVVGVGEAGKEAVVPLDKFWEKLDAMADGQSTRRVEFINNITINSPVENPEAFARRLATAMQQQLRTV